MPEAVGDQKQCCRCKETKHVSEFNRRSRNKDGLAYHCKVCNKIENDNKRERLREIDHKSYYKHRKSRIAKSSKYNYLEKGKELPEKWSKYLPEPRKEVDQKEAYEKALRRIRNYKRDNREKMREAWKEYYYSDLEGSRERARISTRKYNTRKSELRDDLHKNDIEFLLVVQEGKCACCKEEFNEDVNYEIDHVVPVSKGGGLFLGNVQLLCRSCNASKNNNTVWYRNRPELPYLEFT